MIKFNKLDFQICNIPEHMRFVYIFVKNNKVYLTFDYEYFKTQTKSSTDVAVKRLQATNILRVPFTKKKIINANKKLFQLYQPTENDKIEKINDNIKKGENTNGFWF